MAVNHARIIDAHLHLDDKISGPAINAARALDQKLADSNISSGIVLHLETQPWPIEDVAEAIAGYDRLIGFANIHPFADDAAARLDTAKQDLGFSGLKLHPRLQSYDIADDRVAALARRAGELGLPVLVDAFPDGDWLMMGFDPLAFARLALSCPKTTFIFGHFGGHHCIDMMMLAKRIPNMHFDFSFSLLYYHMGSTIENIMYCCKSMRCDRIFYGSDYPGKDIRDSLSASQKLFTDHGFTQTEIDKLFGGNISEVLGWSNA